MVSTGPPESEVGEKKHMSDQLKIATVILSNPGSPEDRQGQYDEEDGRPSSWSTDILQPPTPRSRQAAPRLSASNANSVTHSGHHPSSHLSPSPPPSWWGRWRWPLSRSLSSPAAVGDASLRRQHSRLGTKPQSVGSPGSTPSARRYRRIVDIVAGGVFLAVVFLVVNVWLFSNLDDSSFGLRKDVVAAPRNETMRKVPRTLQIGQKLVKNKRQPKFLNSRLLALAAHALAESDVKPEPRDLWKEPLDDAGSWRPCSDQSIAHHSVGRSNGYILVSANGGINQQRIAVCNAVTVTRLLNATLVIPEFQYNSVWKDKSQFGDIYQEEHFVRYLKDDIEIVRKLPLELQSLDLEAIGSIVNDSEVPKEAKPSFFLKKILPKLVKNGVVHFVGFGNRLASDPIPFALQSLRCRCNFHALKFVNKIQKTGALLVQRLQKHKVDFNPVASNLLGPFAVPSSTIKGKNDKEKVSRYLALHLRFEIDMAAYSLCYFGGGKEEANELEAFRAIHFPALTTLKKTAKIPSADQLRFDGQCPLTPEEAILMLAALGFKRQTQIYIAGAHIYGEKTRLPVLLSLYPNMVTKEKLLSSSEIEPFMNYSSQLAALDFIACAASDAFAMTDSGSQFSALVSGYRMYYGGGKLPTIRPNKRRLASIFSKNNTIEWRQFEQRVRKAVRQTKRAIERPTARSIYRHPRSKECMCRAE